MSDETARSPSLRIPPRVDKKYEQLDHDPGFVPPHPRRWNRRHDDRQQGAQAAPGLVGHRRRQGRRPRLPAWLPVHPLRHERAEADPQDQAALLRRRCRPGDGRGRRRRPRVPEGDPGGRPHPGLRLPGHRHGHDPAPRPDRGDARPRVAQERHRVLHLRRRGLDPRGAGEVHRRPAGRPRDRDADQVPGRPAGVQLPGRRLLHQARDPRPGRDRLRHPARRRLHQAGGQPRAWAQAGGEEASPSSPTS